MAQRAKSWRPSAKAFREFAPRVKATAPGPPGASPHQPRPAPPLLTGTAGESAALGGDLAGTEWEARWQRDGSEISAIPRETDWPGLALDEKRDPRGNRREPCKKGLVAPASGMFTLQPPPHPPPPPQTISGVEAKGNQCTQQRLWNISKMSFRFAI